MKSLVLAGGLPQIELIKQLKGRGIITVLADGSSNPLAKSYADKFVQIDIFNVEAVKNLASIESVDFIITVCADQVLLVVAQVSEMLGLPCYIDYNTARNVSDKVLMKRIFKANGIPTSNFIELSENDIKFQNVGVFQLRFPLVLKPVDAYSSKGVRRVDNEQQLKDYYYEAAKISRTGGVICEEYCSGEEISVDAFVINGKVEILCVSNSEKIKDDGRFVIYRGRYPVNISDEMLGKIEFVSQKIATAFGLVNAPMLIQMISDGINLSVLEFCARTGGNMKWLLIKYVCGVDVIAAAIDLALGNELKLTQIDTGNRIVVNDFLYCTPGVYDHLEGFEEMVNAGYMNEYHSIRSSGMQVFGVQSSSDRIAGINIVANSLQEFNEKQRRINNSVRIVDDHGKDIMRHDLITDMV